MAAKEYEQNPDYTPTFFVNEGFVKEPTGFSEMYKVTVPNDWRMDNGTPIAGAKFEIKINNPDKAYINKTGEQGKGSWMFNFPKKNKQTGEDWRIKLTKACPVAPEKAMFIENAYYAVDAPEGRRFFRADSSTASLEKAQGYADENGIDIEGGNLHAYEDKVDYVSSEQLAQAYQNAKDDYAKGHPQKEQAAEKKKAASKSKAAEKKQDAPAKAGKAK